MQKIEKPKIKTVWGDYTIGEITKAVKETLKQKKELHSKHDTYVAFTKALGYKENEKENN